MSADYIDFNIEALKARITVLEDFIKAKHPDFPTTPKGNSGTMTFVEEPFITHPIATPKGNSGTMTGDEHSHGDEIEGYITPLFANGVNIREFPTTRNPFDSEGGIPFGEYRHVKGIVNDEQDNNFKWYRLDNGNYVRDDVVTFSKEKPDAPITPINASTWPMPISGYTVTNTHHNHRQHVGIDLAAPLGTKIYSAPNEGYVMKAFHCAPCGDDPTKQMHLGTGEASYGYGLGNYVVVRYYQHPAENKGHFLFVLYAHLSRINVQEKAALPPYTVIGDVGTSGNSTGSHLHIECRYSDNPLADFYAIRANEIDPSTIFKA
jgi:murein DD-endopeptidase MepM/ murein hydrolase activator NlpD